MKKNKRASRKDNMKKENKITSEQFRNWLSECPVPCYQTDNGLNLTENYEFDLTNVEFNFEQQASEQKG